MQIMTGKYVQHNYPRNARENHIQQNGQNSMTITFLVLDQMEKAHTIVFLLLFQKKKLAKCIKQLKKDSEDRGKKTVCIRTIRLKENLVLISCRVFYLFVFVFVFCPIYHSLSTREIFNLETPMGTNKRKNFQKSPLCLAKGLGKRTETF